MMTTPTSPTALPFVRLFTDGACSGNPGPGGWGFILRHPASGKATLGVGSAMAANVIEGPAPTKVHEDLESAVIRFLGGLSGSAFSEFDGPAEREENKFNAELFQAMREDLKGLRYGFGLADAPAKPGP